MIGLTGIQGVGIQVYPGKNLDQEQVPIYFYFVDLLENTGLFQTDLLNQRKSLWRPHSYLEVQI